MTTPNDRSHAGFRVWRLVWVALALLTLLVWAEGVPVRWAALNQVCTTSTAHQSTGRPGCVDQQAGPDLARHLAAAGLSLRFFANYVTTVEVLYAASFWIVGLVIAWRRRHDWFALFVALFLILWGTSSASAPSALALLRPAWSAPAALVGLLGGMAFPFFLALFPDGRFRPRWMRVVAALSALTYVGVYLPSRWNLDPNTWSPVLSTLVFWGPMGLLVGAQVYRYRRAADPAQRQQTRWVLFGLVAGLGIVALILFISNIAPNQQGLGFLVGDVAFYFGLFMIPLAIGFSILRTRLFDIDIIIRRTLVYTGVTALLAAVYFGSVILLQGLAGELARGRQPEIVTVLSTLVIAALFRPVRSRVQALVDRRFYRRKYDTARTLAAFGATVRDQVELSSLAAHLLATVEETMQPAHASLWLPAAGGLSPRSRESSATHSPHPDGAA